MNTLGVSSLDELLRKKIDESQTSTISTVTLSTNKAIKDALMPIESRFNKEIETLQRDVQTIRSYLSKINELMNEMNRIELKVDKMATSDDLQEKFSCLTEFVKIPQFRGLERIVSEKAEQISLKEVKNRVDGQDHHFTEVETKILNLDAGINVNSLKLEKAKEERNQMIATEKQNILALDNKCTELKTMIGDNQRDIDVKMRKIAKESKEKLDLLVTKQDIERVYRRFTDFAEKEDLIKH